jgi:hypothetical protein
MSDDGAVTTVELRCEQSREQREEQAVLDEQRRQAEEDRARRARERLEMMRQAGIQAARKAAGLCVFCGDRLSCIARLFAGRHRRCRSFSE